MEAVDAVHQQTKVSVFEDQGRLKKTAVCLHNRFIF